jgi:L-ribulokinase
MTQKFLIGIDYGTESARGVLVDAESGAEIDSHTVSYPHGVIASQLPSGEILPRGWALQQPQDYLLAARAILTALGSGKQIEGIGLGFTASSPMPVKASGTPLSDIHPHAPHAYVKLWKHASAQSYADEINARGGAYLHNFGGKLSGEWLLAKAAQIRAEAPKLWGETDKFIEAGDWVVWQLTGHESRSLGFAAYKAQFNQETGYPDHVVEGLASRLSTPLPIGSAAGLLTEEWRAATGISGQAAVAVAVIDSHMVLPAVGGVRDGALVAAIGTSAVYLHLSRDFKPLPSGIEGVAKDGSVAGFWCYEAGQAGFGDTLAWFVKTFPRDPDPARNFAAYNAAAAEVVPGASRLVALDWWSGNRVPLADSALSGLLVGLNTQTSAAEIYRALLEALCFGARSILELFANGGLPASEIIVTSGLAANNPLLVQILADVLDREVLVPQIDNPTAIGAVIHGAVASGLVADYAEGGRRFGAQEYSRIRPNRAHTDVYEELYTQYRTLSGAVELRDVMHGLDRVASSAGVKSAATKRSVA